MKSTRVQFLMVVVAALLVVTLTQAQVVKKAQGSLDDLKLVSSRMRVPAELAPVNDMRAAESQGTATPILRDLYSGWDRFQTENGTGWWMTVDKRTGKPALISGSGIPWVPGKGNSISESAQVVTTDSVVNLARQFVDRYPELFGVDNADLEVMPESTGEFGGYLWYVHLQRTFHGIPVEKSYVVFRVNNGNLVQFGGEFLSDINLDPIPTISVETAQQIFESYVGGFQPGDNWADAPRISVIPFAPQGDVGMYKGQVGKGVEYRLVYTLAFQRPDVMGTWTAKVDAHTGEVLAFADANMYGSIKGGIYVTSNLDTEKVVPMPYANTASGTYANAAGVYSATSGTVTCTLAGKYVKVTDSCGAISLSATAPADMTFGTSSGTDCTTPGTGGAGNTHATRTGYYHLTLWKEKAIAWLPGNSWLTGQVTDKVNLSQTCNAYWDGSAVNFFKSGGGCSNTGELPTVFLHEIGHGLDSNDGSPSSTVGSSEVYGDTNGVLMTHNSCLGINFIPGQNCSGYGNACSSCTGIRDADYMKHSTQTPAKPSNLSGSSGYHCSTDSSYPGPCGYEGHCESVVGSEALYTFAANTTYGLPSSAGGSYDSNTAWFIADRLFFLTRPTAGDVYTCSSPSSANGCGTSNWYEVYLVADDDNGNLSDGTPHTAAIYAAFNAHAVACSTGVHTSSSTCTVGQPTNLATSSGSGNVGLTWTAPSSGTAPAYYAVLRNEISSTAGMMILGTTTSVSYTDSMVASGVTYYYAVVGYTGSAANAITTIGGACHGKVSSVVSGTPGTGTTYSISGTITGATSVAVALTGAATANTTTDGSGNYTFGGLANGSYTVTPSKSGYTFSPVNIAVTISSANQTGKNFTGTAAATYSISGTVTGATTVTVNLTGAATANTTTDGSGNYTFSGLVNGSYTVTPSKSGFTFSPTSTGVTISSANQTGINFTGTAAATYSISGTVTGAATVTMNLTGASTGSTTTDGSGNYTFSGLGNGSYTVTPSKSGYTFTPVNIAVTIASANQTGKNFTGTASGGDTALTSGVGVAGSVTLQTWKYYTIVVPSGATNLTVTLTGLSADVDLYVNNSATHPTTSAYYGRSWNSGTTNETLTWAAPTVATWSIGVYGYAAGNYTVTATVITGTTTYSISGTVTGATSVAMALTGAATANTTTDGSGNYTFSGLANGSYTVTPSKSGYTFSPTSMAVTISGANQTGKNFTGTTGSTYSISGTVSGATASGVTMNLTGAATASTTTDTSGNYTFAGLANGSYTVTPSKTGYTFSPVNIAVTIASANQTGKNFTATATGGDIALTSGVGVSTGALTLQTWKYYTIVVPSGATNLAVTLTGLSADLDLYVNNSATHPTTSAYYGASTNGGTTTESLSYATPTVATWSIGVYAYAAGTATVTATVTTGGGGTTLLTDGFESAGWSTAQVSGTAGAWTFPATGSYPTASPHGGTKLADFNSYTSASGSATRVYRSSTLAIGGGYTTVSLKFWMYHDTGYTSNADKVQAVVSTNGTTWTNVGTAVNRYTGATGWAQATVDISTYKGQTVYIGFVGTSAYGNDCYLDDVTVVAQ